MKRIPELDGIRGFAILLVLWAHFPRVAGFGGDLFFKIAHLINAGRLGVSLFFVLSGYLITEILISGKGGKIKDEMIRFYRKRALRIWPIYFLTIACLFVLMPSYNYIYTALYLSNYYFAFDLTPHPLRHTWSLAVEEQFYLVWPAVIFLIRDVSSIKKTIAAIAALSLAASAFIYLFIMPGCN